ncbi:MAG: tetratricopeptide repeat protein [Bacteroidota bacterium]
MTKEKLHFHNHQSPEELKELEDCRVTIEDKLNKNPQEALDLSLKYEDISKKYKHQEHFAESLSLKGQIFYHLGRNHESLNLLNIAIKFTSNEDLKYKLYVNLGALYTYFGQFSKAIEIYNVAISSSKNSQNCTVFNNIAAIYFKQKDYEKTIEYLNKALELIEDNIYLVTGILNNIGRSYIEINDLDNAELILNKAAQYLDEIENPTQEMINTLNIGLLLFKQEKYDEAYKKLLDAYIKCKNLDLKNNLYSATLFLAHASFKNNLLDQANAYYIEAMDLVRNIDKRIYNATLKEYINFIVEQGDYERAINYFIEYDKNKDDILAEDKNKEINALTIKFQNTEQKLEIEKLNREKEFQNKLLAQAEDLKKTNEKLMETNQNLSDFSYALSHDIRTPIRQLAGFSSMIRNKDYEGKSELLKNDLNYIFDAAKKADTMINDLHQFSIVGIQEDKFINVDTNESLKDALGNLSQNIIDSHAIIEVKNNLPYINGNKTLFMQLFQNLIGNAIKYAKKDIAPHIEIDYQCIDEKSIISIKDNGIGIPLNEQKDIFKLFGRASNHSGVEGTGIGLSFCYKIVQKTNGNIRLVSDGIDKGTTIFIEY